MKERANRRELATFFVILGIGLVGSMIADLGETLILSVTGTDYPSQALWAALVILGGFLFALYRFAAGRLPTVFGSDVKWTSAEREAARPVLLTGYSPMKESKAATLNFFIENIPLAIAAGSTEDFENWFKVNFKELSPNISQYAIPWQQTLRAAYHHREKLEKIFILLPGNSSKKGRENNENNDPDIPFDQFCHFIISMFAKDNYTVSIEAVKAGDGEPFFIIGRKGEVEPPSYEDYEYCYEGLRCALDNALDQQLVTYGNMSDRIVVDVTPGLKIFSIAAAIITLNLDLKFSYVTSEGQVMFYDALLRFRFNT